MHKRIATGLRVTAVLLAASGLTLGIIGTTKADGDIDLRVRMTGLVEAEHIGWGVDPTTGGQLCVGTTGVVCRRGAESHRPGGFSYPVGVATDDGSDTLYVTDTGNHRVQALGPGGVSLSVGRSFMRGTLYPGSIAVAPDTGDVYVLDTDLGRASLDKYFIDGRLAWRTGGTAGVLNVLPHQGNLLTFDERRNLVYVGDEHRVREFAASGRWLRDISLVSLSVTPGSSVDAIALDRDANLYVVYDAVSLRSEEGSESADGTGTIRKFNAKDEQVAELTIGPRHLGAKVEIDGLAIDRWGVMAMLWVEVNVGIPPQRFGALYDSATGRLIDRFPAPTDNDGITFDGHGDLYVAATDEQQVTQYTRSAFGDLISQMATCEDDPAYGFFAASDCVSAGNRGWRKTG